MDKMKGIASDIRTTTSISGGGNDTAVSTTHICIFSLNGKRVQLSFGAPIHLDEGDDVALVGESKNGLFNAIAYKNITKGIQGIPSAWTWIGFGAVFVIVPLFMLQHAFSGFGPEAGIPILCVVIPFSLVGLVIVFKGLKIRRAVTELQQFASGFRTA